jgi:hypothetical protein
MNTKQKEICPQAKLEKRKGNEYLVALISMFPTNFSQLNLVFAGG